MSRIIMPWNMEQALTLAEKRDKTVEELYVGGESYQRKS